MKWSQLDFIGRLLTISPPTEERAQPAEPPAAKAKIPRGNDAALCSRGADLLRKAGCEEIAAKLRVLWSGRLHSTAGLAYPGKALIKLNPRLNEFGGAEVERTLLHELAHLVAQYRAGRRRIAPHGPEWRRACADLGLTNERRCHDLPLPRREVSRKHRYLCPACGYELCRVRPLRRPSACLACCRKHNDGKFDERFRLAKVKAARA